MGGASPSGGGGVSHTGPNAAGVKASSFCGGNGKETCTASSPTGHP